MDKAQKLCPKQFRNNLILFLKSMLFFAIISIRIFMPTYSIAERSCQYHE